MFFSFLREPGPRNQTSDPNPNSNPVGLYILVRVKKLQEKFNLCQGMFFIRKTNVRLVLCTYCMNVIIV